MGIRHSAVARAASLALLAGALSVSLAHAEDQTFRAAEIFVPGAPIVSADIVWPDSALHQVYVADRSNGSVDVFDTQSNLFVKKIGGFVGAVLNPDGSVKNDVSGPDGVVVTQSGKELYVGDGDSTVKVVDLQAGTIVASIPTGGKNRADELAYDPQDQLILIANNADDPPFLTFISTASRSVAGKIMYSDATDGVEQPLWDAQLGMFFQAVPETKDNPGGEIDVIDPKSMMVVKRFNSVGDPSNHCHPQGLALGPNQHLLTGCNPASADGSPRAVIFDANTGELVVPPIDQPGGADEVWYNPGDHRFYLAERSATIDGQPGGMGVIDADTNTPVEAVHTGAGAHSLAADARLNHIYVPIYVPDTRCPQGCLVVFESGGAAQPVDDLPPGH
jgi:DNA-binding beta-propeller fold protein YncE